MCSREFSTASRWYRLISTGSVSLNTPPTGLRASAGFSFIWPSESSVSWLSFSSSVICPSSESMRRSTLRSPAPFLAAPAGSAAIRHSRTSASALSDRRRLMDLSSQRLTRRRTALSVSPGCAAKKRRSRRGCQKLHAPPPILPAIEATERVSRVRQPIRSEPAARARLSAAAPVTVPALRFHTALPLTATSDTKRARRKRRVTGPRECSRPAATKRPAAQAVPARAVHEPPARQRVAHRPGRAPGAAPVDCGRAVAQPAGSAAGAPAAPARELGHHVDLRGALRRSSRRRAESVRRKRRTIPEAQPS